MGTPASGCDETSVAAETKICQNVLEDSKTDLKVDIPFKMAEFVDLPELADEEVPPELLEELERELARNAEANRLAKERELEAKAARERAAQSQKTMEQMMQRFEDIKNKVERTRQTLTEAAERARKHEELKSTIDELKARTEKAILFKKAAAAASAEEKKMNENKMDYAQTVQNCQDKLVLGKKPDSDSPPREKPTIESVEAARAKLSATAVRIQQKCHNVNQRLDEIALSEETIRANEAKCLAAKREKEAVEAQHNASKKEQEAKEMRRKVMEMQRALLERKNKLRATEDTTEKKGNVVEKVNKLLNMKERRCKYVENKKLETVMFAPTFRVRSKMGEDNDKVEEEEVAQESPVNTAKEDGGEIQKPKEEVPSEIEEEGNQESTEDKD